MDNTTTVLTPPKIVVDTSATLRGFEVTLFISMAVGILSVFAFSILRMREKRFFLPRIYAGKNGPPPESNLFSWISYTLYYSETRLLHSAGFDAVMYIRFLKYSIVLFGVLSVISIAFLMPINVTAENKQKPSNDAEYVVGLNTFSLANIPAGSSRLWAHLLSVFLFTLMVYYYIYKLYKAHIQLDDLSKSSATTRAIQARTVMVRELPRSCINDEALIACFAELYGKKNVLYATVVPFVEELAQLKEMRNNYIKKLAIAREIMNEQGNNIRPIHRMGFCGLTKVDSISYYKEQIESVELAIEHHNRLAIRSTRTGFVTFTSVITAQQAAQSLHDKDPHSMVVEPAPEPNDINWKWLITSKTELYLRSFVVYTLIGILFLFWTIPITFISAFANLSTLSKVEGLDFLINLLATHPVIKGLVEGFLPSLALLLFLVILPYILREILRYKGHYRHSEFDRQLVRFYWLFLLLNVFLVSVFAGTFFDVLSRVLAQPSTFISLLATSLPSQALYFTNYIILQGYAGYPIFWLMRLDEYFICKIKQWFFCKTRKERMEAEEPMPLFYALLYSRELLVFSIALSYSSMVPLMLPFATLYFALSYLITKHNFVYVFTPHHEGNRMTLLVIDRIVVGLVIYQATMMGVLGLKLFPMAAAILLLMIMTGFLWYYGISVYAKPLQFIALRDCPKAHYAIEMLDEERLLHIRRMYVHPALLLPSEKESIIDDELAYDQEREGISLDESIEVKQELFKSPSTHKLSDVILEEPSSLL